MSALDLSTKTVIELRKIAKENGVTLGAGVSKADIIAKLESAGVRAEPDLPEALDNEQENQPIVSQVIHTAPAAQPQGQPQFRAAWHNPTPRYGTKPAYQAPRPEQRQPYGRFTGSGEPQRPAPTRPVSYTPRFGPAAQDVPPETAQQPSEESAYHTYNAESQRPAAPDRRYHDAPRPNGFEERPHYDSRPAYDERPRYENRAYENQRSYEGNRYDDRYARQSYGRRDNGYYGGEPAVSMPSASAMLAPSECEDGAGILEMHPDGYGFLRGENFLPSSHDYYISPAQIRRFGLRTGDRIVGKTRPQRDGDKYAAMLYLTEVNGMPPEALLNRPSFDELTPVYPSRKINLESGDKKLSAMRLIDLITPLGFGQRGLLLCPPGTGKTQLLQSFANVIAANHPDVKVLVLLIDENPEDVTLFREQVSCPVLASTFDQPPESHLRLTDMVMEHAERHVEQGKDVIVIVDSLTRLAKVYTTAAQQNRSVTGMVNPSSLFRAKRLFGAARCIKEGGSLTIIGAMNIETGNKVDDSVVEEFKGTANMELTLDSSVARAGIFPAINLPLSGTKRAEALLDAAQIEGLQIIRSMIGSTRSVTAIPQLLSMMDMASTNDELLAKIKDWSQLMASGK